jgi:hypothetical protein
MKSGKIIGGISENISVGSKENPARFGEEERRREIAKSILVAAGFS